MGAVKASFISLLIFSLFANSVSALTLRERIRETWPRLSDSTKDQIENDLRSQIPPLREALRQAEARVIGHQVLYWVSLSGISISTASFAYYGIRFARGSIGREEFKRAAKASSFACGASLSGLLVLRFSPDLRFLVLNRKERDQLRDDLNEIEGSFEYVRNKRRLEQSRPH
jgi:hypothetical protein